MKRYIRWVLCLSLLLQPLAILLAPNASSADPVNLIQNPSVENGTTTPSNWVSNKWGTNSATFSYKKDGGQQGSRSVHVNMTQYSTGDAKWYFNPVGVQPGTNYTFTDYYKSSVPTVVVAASYDAAGNPTYTEVSSTVAASSTTWKQLTVQIKTPANSAKLTVFHLINRNGWLQLDSASLTAGAPPLPTALPPNGSFEQATGDAPSGWAKEGWGNNTRSFSYATQGRTGTKSAKVTVSNYVDGDAKWAFTPLALPAGKDYRFSMWYKTNTQPRVVARFISNNGTTETYHGLPNPEPSGSTTAWQFYSDTFYVPPGTESVTTFMFIAGNGWVQTDDYSITSYTPTPLSQGLVSITIDDGHEENNVTVLPKLNDHGFKATYCYATEYIEGIPSAIGGVKSFYNAGHEVCAHTVSHPDLTTISSTQLVYELTHSKQYLESITGPVKNFASPFGSYNVSVNNEIKKHFRSHRTVDEGYNSKDNFNPYRIRVQNMRDTTTLTEFQSWLNKAKADKTWLVLVYHRVTTATPGPYDTKESDFAQQLNALQASGLSVKTYNAALDQVTAQL